MSDPATQAVMKQAMEPPTRALKATLATSCLREGARVPRVAIWMPIEDGFEKPHSAYVAISLRANGIWLEREVSVAAARMFQERCC